MGFGDIPNSQGSRPIFTGINESSATSTRTGIGEERFADRSATQKGVPEVARAVGLLPSRWFGAIYGSPIPVECSGRIPTRRITTIGGIRNSVDECVWLFKDKAGKVMGRVGVHVDDFLIAEDMSNPEWLAIGEQPPRDPCTCTK